MPLPESPTRPGKFYSPSSQNFPVRFLPVDASVGTSWSDVNRGVLNRYFIGPGGSAVHCKGANCPACSVFARAEQRVHVPVQSARGHGHLSLSAAKYRALSKQIQFGMHYGLSGASLRDRLQLPHWKLAPKRKRAKRIAKKIEKRGGWMTLDPGRVVARSLVGASIGFEPHRAELLNRQVHLAFDRRPDVVEMRECMLAAGVPREERRKAYRALRRLTLCASIADDLGVGRVDMLMKMGGVPLRQPLVVHDSLEVNWGDDGST